MTTAPPRVAIAGAGLARAYVEDEWSEERVRKRYHGLFACDALAVDVT